MPFLYYIHLIRKRCLHLVVGYKACLVHALYHRIRAVVGYIHLVLTGILTARIRSFISIAPWVIAVRAFYHAGKHGAFPYAKLGKLLAEIVLCRRLHAVVGLTKVYVVEISFQYIVLIHNAFYLNSKINFLYLPPVGYLAR